MNAIDLLKKQHDEVDELIAKIEKSKDASTRRATFRMLADNLAAHIAIEERLFYPAVMAKQTEDKLLEAVEEHLAIKRVLADMLELSVTDAQFDPKLSLMKETLDHHNREEEEGELFPKVRKLLGADELDGLGGEMLSMFEELMSAAPRLEVPAETSEAASLPAP